jgi:2-C-methyl-D-erythritol 4-phosphate cytidylyltransferase
VDEYFTSVVIVAAGKGTRMNMDISKQYVEVARKPVLARTIQAFEDCDFIHEIILVVNEYDILHCKQEIIEKYGFQKVKSLVSGGSERQSSVYNGLREVNKACEVVLIHDGARPFIEENTILACVEGALLFDACCTAVPVKDTIKTASEDGFIKETLKRSDLWSIQTPQAFKYQVIMDAHRRAAEEGFLGTDDAVLVERAGFIVKLIKGSYNNIKITTQEDLTFAEAIAEVLD